MTDTNPPLEQNDAAQAVDAATAPVAAMPQDTDAQPDPAWQTPEAAPPAEDATADATPAPVAETDAEAEADEPAPMLPTLDRLPRPQKTRLISLINQKGGVGKTTTTVNLGAALAASGLRVLMIDLDPQAHLTLSLGIDPNELEYSVYDLMTDPEVSAAQIVQSVDGCDRLGVLPAETDLASIDNDLAEMVKTGLAQTILRTRLQGLLDQFDYVLIDCPPALGLLTINALTLADEVIVPMQAHYLAMQGMEKLFETVGMIRQGINPNITVAGVVLCMHESQTLHAREVIQTVTDFFEAQRGTAGPLANAVVYDPPIRRNIKLAEAPSFGVSVLAYAPESNGAKDYAKLARSVALTTV